jgi:hypothetical protein
MPTRFSPFVLPELRGLDQNENPHGLPTASLSSATNVWRLGRSIGTRPGTILDPDEDYAEPIVAGAVVGIADYRRNRNASRTLVVVVPGAIHTDDGTTLTLGAGVVVDNAAERPWTFVQHKNKLFAAGGDVGVADTAWYWDAGAGTTANRLVILNNAGANIEPRFICEFGNRLFAGGFTGTDPSGNPGIVRYSALNDGLTWPTENTIGGNFSVGGFAADAEEYVTGLSTYKSNDGRWLLVGTNRRLYPLLEGFNPAQLFTTTDEISVGCAGHLLYVNPGVDSGDAVYVSDEGIHSMRETQEVGPRSDRFLSWKIRKAFKDINRARLDWAVAGYWREHGLAVIALPTGSSLVNNLVLVLDMKDSGDRLSADSAMWFPWTMSGTNHQISYLAPGRLESGLPVLYWGDQGGRVGVFTTDTYADLGVAYTSRFRTKFSDFNSAMATKTLGDFLVDAGAAQPNEDYNPLFQAIFDWGSSSGEVFPIQFTESGSWVLGVSILGVDTILGGGESIFHHKFHGSGEFQTCAFDVQHTGVDQPFYIHRIAGEVAATGEGQEANE